MREEAAGEFGTGLIDVTGFSLSQLDELGESSRLALALRRLVEETDSGPVAGFQSSL